MSARRDRPRRLAIRALEDALIESTLRIVSAIDDHEVADWLDPDLDDPS